MTYYIPWAICFLLLGYIIYMKKAAASNNNFSPGATPDNNKYKEFIDELTGSIVDLSNSSNMLDGYVHKIKSDIEGVSATTQELSAAIEETAASSQEISASVSEMENMMVTISTETSVAGATADEVRARAGKLKQSSIQSKNETEQMYETVKKSLVQAIEQSQAVSQIYNFADIILSLAAQTKMLSLNANIEAARSGEHGRGFAVVATEINKLAKLSSDTAANIKSSIDGIKLSVQDLSASSQMVMDFIDNNVLSDYENLIELSEQYYTDSDKFNSSINKINEMVEQLCNTGAGISTAVTDLTRTAVDEASGTQDIASTLNDILASSNLIFQSATENAQNVEKLAERILSMES